MGLPFVTFKLTFRGFLGFYTMIWIHEIMHGIPSLLFIGPWGFGAGKSGLPIALPIGGLFIPNFTEWEKLFNTWLHSGNILFGLIKTLGFLLATLLCPYILHGLAFLLDRALQKYNKDTFSGMLLFASSHPGSSIGVDLGLAATLCILPILFALTIFTEIDFKVWFIVIIVLPLGLWLWNPHFIRLGRKKKYTPNI